MTKKILSRVPAVLSVLFLLWIGLSFIDIVMDNNTLSAAHSNYNFFVWCLGVFQN